MITKNYTQNNCHARNVLPAPISKGEGLGKRPEENRATTKPDERSQNKLSERHGDW